MVKVITDYPVALDSPDYLHPWGTIRDNTMSREFWASLKNYRQDKLSYLDLGCAGGGLVLEAFLEQGHDAIGLEGSDYWVKHQNETVEDSIERSLKYGLDYAVLSGNQWKKFHNTRLFTCDISQPFSIIESTTTVSLLSGQPTVSNQPKKFDLITAWEVLEHIAEDRIPTLFENVFNHMSDEGSIFVGTVSLVQDSPEGFELHQTVKSAEWWLDIIEQYFILIPWTVDNIPIHPARLEANSSLFILRKKV